MPLLHLPPPGPVEAAILKDLAPTFTERLAVGDPLPLRVLEGGEGPPLVLLHGRGGSGTSWFPLLPALAQRYRVIAVDLPGFGRSAIAPFRGRGFEAGVAYFTAPVEAFLEREGITAPALLGHSLGGLVAVELTLRGRIAPRALALIGSMGLGPAMHYQSRMFFRAGPERIARAVGRSGFSRLIGVPSLPTLARPAALAYEHHTARARTDASHAFDALYPTIGPVPNRLDRLGAITAPTLVLWGDKDKVIPSPVAIAAAAALPNAELRIEPLGHVPHIEATDRVLPVLLRFLG